MRAIIRELSFVVLVVAATCFMVLGLGLTNLLDWRYWATIFALGVSVGAVTAVLDRKLKDWGFK